LIQILIEIQSNQQGEVYLIHQIKGVESSGGREKSIPIIALSWAQTSYFIIAIVHSSSPTQQPLVPKSFYGQSNQTPMMNSLVRHMVCLELKQCNPPSILGYIDAIGKP